MGQDALIGLTAPVVAYLLATQPSITTYVIAVAWMWWGITDFCVGLVVERYQPPYKVPFGPNTPTWMLTVWLVVNVGLQIYAFYLMWTAEISAYFTGPGAKTALSIADSPMGGNWIWIIVGAASMGVFFGVVGATINGMFKMLGFKPKTSD